MCRHRSKLDSAVKASSNFTTRSAERVRSYARRGAWPAMLGRPDAGSNARET